MRTSRLRVEDVIRLFILQYPLRCRNCLEREYVNLFSALNLRKAEKARHRDERNTNGDENAA